jgi:TRAP-type C4-dicarboxylate transport system permease large subunit
MIVIAIVARQRPEWAPPSARIDWPQRWRTLFDIWPIVVIFVLVFGGIYAGWFSPTEGAAVGAVATGIVGQWKGELGLKGWQRSLAGTAETSAMVFMIFLGADMMNAALALTELPAAVAAWVGQLPVDPLWIVAAVLLLYVVLGCVMDELSMLLLTLPVIFPAMMALPLLGLQGQEKAIWFGILVLMTVGIGLIAPPVGLNVYVVNGLAREVPIGQTYRGVFPFLVSDLLRIVLLLAFPGVTLWLVRVLFVP